MYDNLNDAATYCPALAVGATEIWYMRNEWFRDGIDGKMPDLANLEGTHIMLGTVIGKDRETLWQALQGETWSPGGVARDLIAKKGLRHTSMSMGDIVIIDRVVYLATDEGFRRLDRRPPSDSELSV